MKNYKIQPTEVVRYQGQVTLQTEQGDILPFLNILRSPKGLF